MPWSRNTKAVCPPSNILFTYNFIPTSYKLDILYSSSTPTIHSYYYYYYYYYHHYYKLSWKLKVLNQGTLVKHSDVLAG